MVNHDEIEAQFERDRRKRRWEALSEDGAMFGLTPNETLEFERLDREFSPNQPQEDER
jgi:hypothetical protein